MPVFHGVETSATYGLAPSATEGPYSPEVINSLSVQSNSPSDDSNQWNPVPTSIDPNRPNYSTIDPYPTATLYPVATPIPESTSNDGSINTGALVGIIVSAGIIIMAVALVVIWWIRGRSKSRHGFGHRQRQQQFGAIDQEEEKPPTYEAAVFGIHRNDQGNLSLPHIPQQSFPAPPVLQIPLQTHHIHPSRPLSSIIPNGTLHRLDTTVSPNRNIAQQHSDIVIYPHDSPPSTPTQSTQQNRLSTRSSQINFNCGTDEIRSSHHITDFSEDYPDTVSYNDDCSDNEPTIAREII